MDRHAKKMYDPQETIERYKKNAFDPLRIESITEQLRQICYSGYTNILEIGIAGGFLRHCFKLFPQISLTSLDIAEDLRPDYVGSVTNMPFEDSQFDVIVCGEVLEHLPFTDFLQAMKEIRKVARHKVIISLQDKRYHFGFAVLLGSAGLSSNGIQREGGKRESWLSLTANITGRSAAKTPLEKMWLRR